MRCSYTLFITVLYTVEHEIGSPYSRKNGVQRETVNTQLTQSISVVQPIRVGAVFPLNSFIN